MPTNGDWIAEDTCKFRDLVQDKEFVSYVIGVSLDPVLQQSASSPPKLLPPCSDGKATPQTRLLLKLVDTSAKDKDIFIDDLLVKQGCAKYMAATSTTGASSLKDDVHSNKPSVNDSERSK